MPLSNYLKAKDAKDIVNTFESDVEIERRAINTCKHVLDRIREDSINGLSTIKSFGVPSIELDIIIDNLTKKGYTIKTDDIEENGYTRIGIDWSNPIEEPKTYIEGLDIAVGDTFKFEDLDDNVTGTWSVTTSDKDTIRFDQLYKRTDLRIIVSNDGISNGMYYQDGNSYIRYKTLDWGISGYDKLYIQIEGQKGFLAEKL